MGVKHAEEIPLPGATQTAAGVHDDLRTELVRKLLVGAPLAAGVGAGLRGLLGIRPLLARHMGQSSRTLPSRTGVLRVTSPEDTPAPSRRRVKQAGVDSAAGSAAAAAVPSPAPAAAAGAAQPPVGWNAAHTIAKNTGMLNPAGKDRGWMGWLLGDNASRLERIPVSAALPLGLPLAMMGGYGMTDWILDRTRKKELDSELDNAKGEYEQALHDVGQLHAKTGSAEPYPELDKLAAYHCEKQQEKQAIWDSAGLAGALALTGTGATALLSGKMTYDFLRARDKAKVLNEAYRRRQQQLFAQAPFPTMAVLESDLKKKDDKSETGKAQEGE